LDKHAMTDEEAAVPQSQTACQKIVMRTAASRARAA